MRECFGRPVCRAIADPWHRQVNFDQDAPPFRRCLAPHRASLLFCGSCWIAEFPQTGQALGRQEYGGAAASFNSVKLILRMNQLRLSIELGRVNGMRCRQRFQRCRFEPFRTELFHADIEGLCITTPGTGRGIEQSVPPASRYDFKSLD